jgi:hypothetical protein
METTELLRAICNRQWDRVEALLVQRRADIVKIASSLSQDAKVEILKELKHALLAAQMQRAHIKDDLLKVQRSSTILSAYQQRQVAESLGVTG